MIETDVLTIQDYPLVDDRYLIGVKKTNLNMGIIVDDSSSGILDLYQVKGVHIIPLNLSHEEVPL